MRERARRSARRHDDPDTARGRTTRRRAKRAAPAVGPGHPTEAAYGCFLPDLTRFATYRRPSPSAGAVRSADYTPHARRGEARERASLSRGTYVVVSAGKAHRREAVPPLRVRSEAFGDGGSIPLRSAAEAAGGQNLSPPLSWEGAPAETASFALSVIDRHPVAGDFVHWAVLGIPRETVSLSEGASGKLPDGARELIGTSGAQGWHGPKPPAGSGPHPYEFTVWALSLPDLDLPPRPEADELIRALEAASLQSASLTGTYER